MKLDYKMPGYSLHIIPVKHLKTLTVSMRLLAPLSLETVTQRSLLSLLMVSSTKKYDSTLKLVRRLEELYGCNLYSSVSSKGMSHVLNLNATFVNDQYVDEDLLKDVLSLFNDIFYNPNITDGKWNEEILELKKIELSQRFESLKDDKQAYSLNKLFDIMGQDSPLGIETIGYQTDIEKCTSEIMVQTLNNMISNDIKDIYIVGDVDESIVDTFNELLHFKEVDQDHKTAYTFKSNRDEVLEVIEEQEIVQAKLNVGYTVEANFTTSNHNALTVANMIIGGYSRSKMFLNIREKHSMCYYVNSIYEAFNGCFYVTSGIDEKNYQQVLDLIDEQINEVKNGHFTDEDLELAKSMICNSLIKSKDEALRRIGLYYNRDITGKNETIEQSIEAIQSVSRVDVINAVQSIKKDTIYLLKGKDNNNE